MALNKSVSAVPQVINPIPAETYMGLYLRMSLPFLRHSLVLIPGDRPSLDKSASNKSCYKRLIECFAGISCFVHCGRKISFRKLCHEQGPQDGNLWRQDTAWGKHWFLGCHFGSSGSWYHILLSIILQGLIWIVLTMILQKAFQGKTTVKDKILQILFSNLFVYFLFLSMLIPFRLLRFKTLVIHQKFSSTNTIQSISPQWPSSVRLPSPKCRLSSLIQF